jgi:osmotically-inducible protein OsmY
MIGEKHAKLAGIVSLLVFAVGQGCSTTPKAPDVTSNVSNALKQAGLKNVSVTQDRQKGVVTLTGKVTSDAEKANAGSIAQSMAAGQVVGNEIAVLPPSQESAAKSINSDVDAAIAKNLDAALIANRLNSQVKYDVRSAVVTLKGEVNSQTVRSDAEGIAARVPNVVQVVNKLDVKSQMATTSK